MITVNGLVAVLFSVLAVIGSDPSIPQATKDRVTAAVLQAVKDNRPAPQEQQVPAGVTLLRPGPSVVEVGSPRKAAQGTLAQLAIGGVNSDGSRTVSAVLNDAEYAEVTIYSEGKRDWVRLERQFARNDGQQLFWLHDPGQYKWEAVSLDPSGLVMGTSTGRFIIRDSN